MEKLRRLFGFLICLSVVTVVEVQRSPKVVVLAMPKSLVQVNMLYRHGERNPTAEYPKSEFYNETNWKEGFGQLTEAGMKQHYEFGKWIMAHYGPGGLGFLPPKYNHKDYKVFTTEADRTIQSALANSAGIYIPPISQGIAPDTRWNPVPVRSIMATEYDKVFAQFCPVVPETLERLRKERFDDYKRQLPELFLYTDQKTGLGIWNNPFNIALLYDILRVEASQKGKIPEWAQAIFPYPLEKYFIEFLNEYSDTEKMVRLNAGPTLQTILGIMVNKTLGLDEVKLYSFSAHDMNIFSIMKGLNIPIRFPPKYTATIIFELYRDEKKNYFVKVLYRSGLGEEPLGLVIPGCGGTQICPLEAFIDLTRKLMPKDLEKECEPSTPEFIELSKNKRDFRKKHRYPYLLGFPEDVGEKNQEMNRERNREKS